MRHGVNGDPLREGKLDLPELLEEPTPEEWAWARDFIAQRRWRKAAISSCSDSLERKVEVRIEHRKERM